MSKFFKFENKEFELLSKKALSKLYTNMYINSRHGGGGGKYHSLLKKQGLSEQELSIKLHRKKLESRSILIPHLQEIWVNQKGRCFNTGFKLDENLLFTGNQSICAPSTDRIKNELGYEVGNIKIVLRGINKFKNITPEEEFVDVLKNVAVEVCRKYNLVVNDE